MKNVLVVLSLVLLLSSTTGALFNFLSSCAVHERAVSASSLREALQDRDVPTFPPGAIPKREETKKDDSVLKRTFSWAKNVVKDTLGSSSMTSDQCEIPGIIGQHIALDTIPYAVAAHMRDENPEKPLSMFLAGLPGIGKTRFESLLRRYVFKSVDSSGNGDGVLVLHGANYIDPRKVQAYRDEIKDEIARHVWRCARSVIVFDEIQFVVSDLLDLLMHFLGRQQPVTHRGRQIDFRKAIFIFTTNKGGPTVDAIQRELSEKMPRSELHYSHFAEPLRGDFAKKAEWLSYKNLIDYYVPFLAMTRPEVESFVHRAFQSYNCSEVYRRSFRSLSWTPAVVDFVTSMALDEDGYSLEGLSGIEQPIMTTHIFWPIEKLIEGKTNVDSVSLSIENGKLKVATTFIADEKAKTKKNEEL